MPVLCNLPNKFRLKKAAPCGTAFRGGNMKKLCESSYEELIISLPAYQFGIPSVPIDFAAVIDPLGIILL